MSGEWMRVSLAIFEESSVYQALVEQKLIERTMKQRLRGVDTSSSLYVSMCRHALATNVWESI